MNLTPRCWTVLVINYFDNTYLDSGQLSCTICKIAIRSEKTWNIHIKTNLHLENIKKLKEIKETKCPVVTVGKKRPPTPPKPKEVPEKRSKPNTEPLRIQIEDIEHSNDTKHELDDVLKNQLPEGFFDDPKEDAKARNIVYQNPMDVEWERFVKEMQDVNMETDEIVAEQVEEIFAERQLDENEMQILLLSKVVDLDRKKSNKESQPGCLETGEESRDNKATVPETGSSSDSDEISGSELDDEFMNWRSKRAFH